MCSFRGKWRGLILYLLEFPGRKYYGCPAPLRQFEQYIMEYGVVKDAVTIKVPP
jgi:hypothetical protein